MRKNISLRAAVIILLAAIILFWNSYSIKVPNFNMGNQIYGRFFPRVVLIGIIMLSILMIINSIRKPQEEKAKKIPVEMRKRFYGTISMVLLFGIMFTFLGAYAAIFIFIVAFQWFWDIRKPFTLIATPVLVTLGTYLLFHVLLSLRMPEGIIGLF